MRKSDLVVLRHSLNECYVELVSIQDIKDNRGLFEHYKQRYDFSVNINTKTWSCDGQIFKIGNRRTRRGASYEIIGVYDRKSLKSLRTMLNDASDAVIRN